MTQMIQRLQLNNQFDGGRRRCFDTMRRDEFFLTFLEALLLSKREK